MKNKFMVYTCRFHTKVQNKLLIAGWFQENYQNENQLLVYLDRKKLPSVVEEKDFRTDQVMMEGDTLITKRYYIWVDLPKNWKEMKKLQIINSCDGIGEEAFSITTDRLKKRETKLPMYVDQVQTEDDSFRISGWYIDDGNTRICFLDSTGAEYPVELKKKRRGDVRRAYPENREKEVVGFTASYQGKIPKKIRVHAESDTKKSDYTVSLSMSPLVHKLNTVSSQMEKLKDYSQQLGLKDTVFRGIHKVFHKKEDYYMAWFKAQYPSKEELEAQRKHRFDFEPKISVVVPLYKTPKAYLCEMIESVRNQTYANWELCLSDGSGKDSPIEEVLKSYENKDSRIKVARPQKQLQISENTNAALGIATGDYISFADHDDLLAPDVLYECVKVINEHPETEFIYTDEDKVDMKGKDHFMPHFKPDFDLDMLRSGNYICHFVVVKRNLYDKVGNLNSEYDGAQDFDFVLRCVENTSKIYHIPQILYHWRAHKNSTAENPESKEYAYIAGAKAVQAHYDRSGIPAEAVQSEYKGVYRSLYSGVEKPLVSVVIVSQDHVDSLEKCLQSLSREEAYDHLEFVIVENHSKEQETFSYYQKLEAENPKVKIVYWNGMEEHEAAVRNYGASCASGDYVLFIDCEMRAANTECLSEMLGYCMRSDVGAVGAKIYSENGTLQHAGIVVGFNGSAGNVLRGLDYEDPGYAGRNIMAQDYSAVSAACMLVKKSLFQAMGGFDETYTSAFYDVDLCLKLREAGSLIVYDPYAEAVCLSLKKELFADENDKAWFQKRWQNFLKAGDPYYNPHFLLQGSDFTLDMSSEK